MAKLLIDAASLKAMLDKNPEVEVELVKNAAAQIAEQFKRKALDQSSTIVDRLIDEINSKLNYKYHLPEHVLAVIKDAANDHLKKLTEQEATARAKKAFDLAVTHYASKMEDRIDAMVTTAIEKKMAAVFATAARVSKGKVE